MREVTFELKKIRDGWLLTPTSMFSETRYFKNLKELMNEFKEWDE